MKKSQNWISVPISLYINPPQFSPNSATSKYIETSRQHRPKGSWPMNSKNQQHEAHYIGNLEFKGIANKSFCNHCYLISGKTFSAMLARVSCLAKKKTTKLPSGLAGEFFFRHHKTDSDTIFRPSFKVIILIENWGSSTKENSLARFPLLVLK